MTIDAARKAMSKGDLALAQKHLFNALKIQPDNPEIHYNLAMVSARRGDFATASDYFLLCLKAAPDNVELLSNTGNALRLTGRSAEAYKLLNRALKTAPGHVAARCNRGWLNLRAGKYQDAIGDFEAALEQQDNTEDAWRGTAEALIKSRRFAEAQSVLQDSLQRFPVSATLHNSQGVLYNQLRRPEQAIKHFERAIVLAPDSADAHLNHGITSEQLGALDKAETSLLEALRLRPGDPSTHFHLAQLAGHEATAEEVAAIEGALLVHSDGKSRVDLLFALGKSQAKLSRHDAAFPSFIEARQHLSRFQPYDVHKAVLGFQKIAAAYERNNSSDGVPHYVFVVGMPRSGTTLTDQILASHSAVHSLGESGAVGALLAEFSDLRNALYSGGLALFSPERKQQFRENLERRLASTSSSRLLVETSPGNFPYIGLLAELLPNARFVHCSRNPLDTCVSIFEHPLSKAHAYANSLEDLGRYYRGYRKLMTHWESSLDRRLHTVNYEELLANPEQQIRALLNHCSLAFEDQCIHFYETNRPVMTPSASQVRRPLTHKSVGRWKLYEKFLTPLIDELKLDTTTHGGK